MKKLLLLLVVIFVTITASAQAPFTYYRPLPPASVTVPSIPSIPDPDFNYRRTPRRYSSSIPNGINGTTLGVTGQQETLKKLRGLGYNCQLESAGLFARIVTTQGCMHEEAEFNDISFYFFRDKLWKITFEYCKSDAQSLANRIENKYSDHSISDSHYEYMDGDVILTFDGEMLTYQSNTILNLIARSVNGN